MAIPEVEATSHNVLACAAPQAMGRKNDLVVWLRLEPMQQHIYKVAT